MMFTIYEDSEQVFDALSAGANGYLLKKTSHDKILDALKELYEGGAPMSTHIARKVVVAFQKTSETNKEVESLSPREMDVLQLLAKGYLYKEISDNLDIYEKLHVQNRTEAVNKYYGRREV
jgi:DNA-binding NarL/FixJ family response regulator